MTTSIQARPDAANRQQIINIRAQQRQVALIDRAAEELGQTRSAFMLERAVQAAEAVVLDKCLFSVDDATYERFQARLDAPVELNARLLALLSHKAPWDK